MGTPVERAYGAAGRTTLFFFKPDDLVVVGLDVPDDPDSPVSDPDRVDLGVDEARVRDIMVRGVLVPVVFRKNGVKADGSPNSEVVAGRGRVVDTREAWRRLTAAGVPEDELPLVPGVVTKGSDKDILAVMIAENLLRRQETTISAARKARRYYMACLAEVWSEVEGERLVTREQEGLALAETSVVCGVSKKTLRGWFALLDLHPAAQKLVERGEVGAVAATRLLAGVAYDEQAGRLRELVAEGRARGLAAGAEIEARRGQLRGDDELADDHEVRPERARLPGRRQLKGFRERFSKDVPKRTTFTRADVLGLLDFFVVGKPLRGLLRRTWDGQPVPGGA